MLGSMTASAVHQFYFSKNLLKTGTRTLILSSMAPWTAPGTGTCGGACCTADGWWWLVMSARVVDDARNTELQNSSYCQDRNFSVCSCSARHFRGSGNVQRRGTPVPTFVFPYLQSESILHPFHLRALTVPCSFESNLSTVSTSKFFMTCHDNWLPTRAEPKLWVVYHIGSAWLRGITGWEPIERVPGCSLKKRSCICSVGTGVDLPRGEFGPRHDNLVPATRANLKIALVGGLWQYHTIWYGSSAPGEHPNKDAINGIYLTIALGWRGLPTSSMINQDSWWHGHWMSSCWVLLVMWRFMRTKLMF